MIKKIAENGDLCVLGMKGTCKTTLLMHLARNIMEDLDNHLIIFETFPKWQKEFDIIPYMIISDSDVQEKENSPYMQENYSYIQWSKNYEIANESEVLEFLKTNRNCLFLIEAEDMERISAFMEFVIYTCYRKQYLRAKAENLETVNANYWFLCEEAHNLLDSTVLSKKTFNKLRKMQSEFRNLKMHLIVVTLRLQSLSPKIRSTMSLLCSRVSLDDYMLKLRALLRNSEYRDLITTLPKGEFVFPETDQKLTTKPFNQAGKPYEWKPEPEPTIEETTEEPSSEPEQPKTIMGFIKNLFHKSKPEIITQKEYDRLNNLDDKESEPEIKIVREKVIAITIKKPRATKPKTTEPIKEPEKSNMEKLRDVYSSDSQASKDYEAWKKKALAEKKQTETKEAETESKEREDNINEDSKGDFLALNDDDLMFSEEE